MASFASLDPLYF